MKGVEYPAIQPIVDKLAQILSQECNPSNFHLELKYSKLVAASSGSYQNLLQSSKNSIVPLAPAPYKINAKATKQEYEAVDANCAKGKQVRKMECVRKVDLKFGREKIERVVGDGGWVASNKGKALKKQQNMLVDEKQFRLDLTCVDIITEHAETVLKKYGDKLGDSIKVIRFKDQNIYHLSPFYLVKCCWIHETEEKHAKEELFKTFIKDDEEQMDKFILGHLPRFNKDATSKFEIQLQFTEEGVERIMKLHKVPVQLNKFIGDAIHNFRNLSDIYYKCPKMEQK